MIEFIFHTGGPEGTVSEFSILDATGLPPFRAARRALIDRFEHAYFSALVQETGWENLSELARLAGVDRTTFYRIMTRLDIERPPLPGTLPAEAVFTNGQRAPAAELEPAIERDAHVSPDTLPTTEAVT